MRVVFVMTKLGTGGTANLVLQYLPALQDLGVECEVVHLTPSRDPVARARFAAAGVVPSSLDHTRRIDHPRTVWRLARSCRCRDADVLHAMLPTATMVGAIAGRVTRTPVVTTLVSTDGPDSPSVIERTRARLPTLLGVETCAVSHAVANAARGRGHSVHGVVYPGLADVPARDEEAAAQVRSDLGLGSEDRLILGVGRLTHVKGHDTVIRAMPKVLGDHPGTHLAIAGDGEDRGRLEAVIQELGLTGSVSLLGLRDDVPDLLHAADIYVAASFAEGLVGFATLEAALAAKPIVASGIPAVEELLEDGVHALLAEPGDPEALAQAITRFLDEPELGRRLGAAAREVVVENCSMDAAARQLLGFYRLVVDA